MNQGTVVVIEDDADVRNLVVAVLRQSGFEVVAAATGLEGVEMVREKDPVVVTLDLGLPDIDGHEVLRRIRQFRDCYVIMLTGRDDEADTLTALHAGADDYLTKPFRPRELRARVGALLRRPRSGLPAPEPQGPTSEPQGPTADTPARKRSTLRHGGLVLDSEARTARLSDAELALTRSEFDLLQDLMRNVGAVRTKADLVHVVRGEFQRDGGRGYVSDVDERAIEVHIGNLRRKLREDARNPQWLLTVRGVGYRLAAPKTERE